MKKVVVKANIHDDKNKMKAMQALSTIKGISVLEVSIEERTITVIGDVDPMEIMKNLGTKWGAQIESVGPPDPSPEEFWMQMHNHPAYSYAYEENPNNGCVIC